MPSQNTSGLQYDKTHAVTVVASAAVLAGRFVSYAGAHAASAGAGTDDDAQGISEYGGQSGEAISVITGYSALVEAAESIAFGDWIKPAADGSGRAAKGAVDEHCARALGAADAAGEAFECQLLIG